MNKIFKPYFRPYFSYFVVYLSYKISLYTLNKLFSMVDEIVEADNKIIDIDAIDIDANTSTNTDPFSDGTNDIITTHDYDASKEVVNILSIRGGKNGLLPRGAVELVKKQSKGAVKLIIKQFTNLKTFHDKVISAILRPVANILGYLVLKIPGLRGIYKMVRTVKFAIAASLALGAARLSGRFDYWALIFSDALPAIPIKEKILIASIRRLRMGKNDIAICMARSNDIVNLIMDEEIDLERKKEVLIDFFSMYQLLPENHIFKNPYFACIIHVLLILFFSNNKMGFKLALQLLLRLLKNGQISLKTYFEILAQLIAGGVPPIELEVLPPIPIEVD